MHGLFQITNAATAIVVLERLPPALRPTPRSVERGLAHVVIPGRMEIFAGAPPCVLDIAHNEEKARSLVASLREAFPSCRGRSPLLASTWSGVEQSIRANS